MGVPEIFQAIEQTGLSTWLRETTSPFGFYFILLCHTFGFALVVGSNVILDLRILGVAPALPLKPLKSLFRFMWTGFGINAITGLLLIIAYPTKVLTNPDFYVKISFVTLAVITMAKMETRLFGDSSLSEAAMVTKGKLMAKLSLCFWISAIAAGRLLPETARYLIYGQPWFG